MFVSEGDVFIAVPLSRCLHSAGAGLHIFFFLIVLNTYFTLDKLFCHRHLVDTQSDVDQVDTGQVALDMALY